MATARRALLVVAILVGCSDGRPPPRAPVTTIPATTALATSIPSADAAPGSALVFGLALLDGLDWSMTQGQAEALLAGRGLKIEPAKGPPKAPQPWFSVTTPGWNATIYFAEDGAQALDQVVVEYPEAPSAAAGEQRLRELTARLGAPVDWSEQRHRWEDGSLTRLALEVRRDGASVETWWQGGGEMCAAGKATGLAPFPAWALLKYGTSADKLAPLLRAQGAEVGPRLHNVCKGMNCPPPTDRMEVKLGSDTLHLELSPDGSFLGGSLDRDRPAGTDPLPDLRARYGPPCDSESTTHHVWHAGAIEVGLTVSREEKAGGPPTFGLFEAWERAARPPG